MHFNGNYLNRASYSTHMFFLSSVTIFKYIKFPVGLSYFLLLFPEIWECGVGYKYNPDLKTLKLGCIKSLSCEDRLREGWDCSPWRRNGSGEIFGSLPVPKVAPGELERGTLDKGLQ